MTYGRMVKWCMSNLDLESRYMVTLMIMWSQVSVCFYSVYGPDFGHLIPSFTSTLHFFNRFHRDRSSCIVCEFFRYAVIDQKTKWVLFHLKMLMSACCTYYNQLPQVNVILWTFNMKRMRQPSGSRMWHHIRQLKVLTLKCNRSQFVVSNWPQKEATLKVDNNEASKYISKFHHLGYKLSRVPTCLTGNFEGTSYNNLSYMSDTATNKFKAKSSEY